MLRLTLTTAAVCIWAAAANAQTTPTPTSQPTSQPVGADPFLSLKLVKPKDKLPPIRSVRIRDQREAKDRSREGKVRISIGSRPKGARVYYGRKLLGNTPLTLTATKGSTPFDVVIRAGGYMTLRTRIRRKESRGYYFRLHPAKIR